MNKQQLASKIWESANKMRSKIEANEYKDYILGFIFYKFLSDQEEKLLRKEGWPNEDIAELTEDDTETVELCRTSLGYFIPYKSFFSTWIDSGRDFDVSDVTDALASFSRMISDEYKSVYEKIFTTLETGLTKLGDTSNARTKAISGLLQLIKDIPMDGQEDYDVLGFIYEYLISNFAANAGKKAGEFYTPHEVSLLMSEIVANHLKDQEHIKIYDPTSGSGSLLINIGKVVSKHMGNNNNIKYFAQELKENTYNLTRMNLVMRGIKPGNIKTRNADTLDEDWPLEDDKGFTPLRVDAVVSNPPYSQHWDATEDKRMNPRFADYGLAPKSKADYAFLLHDLYHLLPTGIMTIVLPHGVLFRGGEEGEIRRKLIEKNNIDTIIGLPANIFFGTGIPTIIMVLRQKRESNDVLIIDASKHFEKVGKNNKLRASDIKRITDVIRDRKSVEKYSRVVSRDEIRANDYNLNIPRYVDSSEPAEPWDILSIMTGGVPNAELDTLEKYWQAFPHLRDTLYISDETPYSQVAVDNISEAIKSSVDVTSYKENYISAFEDFVPYLKAELIDKLKENNVSVSEEELTKYIFDKLTHMALVDRYDAYQLLHDAWDVISIDLEMINTEGFDTAKRVDPHMVIKKKDNKEQEVQDGWMGRIIPFELVQQTLLSDEAEKVREAEDTVGLTSTKIEEIIDSLSEEEKQGDYLNDDNTAFVAGELNKKIKEIKKDIDSPEIRALEGYNKLFDNKAKKPEKLAYIEEHTEADWSAVEGDVPYAKGKVNARIKELTDAYEFPEDSFEAKLLLAGALLEELKNQKKQAKQLSQELHLKTKLTIENLTDDQVLMLLEQKWIVPLYSDIIALSDAVVDDYIKQIIYLNEKYDTTLVHVDEEIHETEASFIAMLDNLTGDEYDMQGIAELRALLGGE